MQRAFGDLLRVARASGQLGRALEIAGAARLEEAREALLTVLDVAGGGAEGPAWAAWVSVRLCALVTLAEIAERLGDEALVLASAREGLALWERSGLDRADPRLERFAAWERWARDRLSDAAASLQ